ncbi:MAG TPA: tetratricopeptide repeat protein [Thermoanaerobaculia bacterium]|jgi:Ca-activated chloride channel family protein|nr:tetratricopeptide repeat protein [Thermoanaerobaculia bacterium]
MIGRLFSALLSSLFLAGALGMALPFPLPLPSLHLPTAVERWLWNPRERTNAAIGDSRQGDKESRKRAVAAADTALRLAPRDPVVQYDAGTIHLGAGDRGKAAKLLAQAAKSPGLAGAASYNLGNAYLADEDFDRAIAAYQQALRVEPTNPDAKWNLELALRQRQDKRQMKAPAGSKGGQGGGDTPSPSPGNDQKSDQRNGSPTADPGKDQQQAGGAAGRPGAQGQAQNRPGDQPLPQFRNQPDMSAAEAAALLESVENLERQQRRAQAAQRANRRAAKGKDW